MCPGAEGSCRAIASANFFRARLSRRLTALAVLPRVRAISRGSSCSHAQRRRISWSATGKPANRLGELRIFQLPRRVVVHGRGSLRLESLHQFQVPRGGAAVIRDCSPCNAVGPGQDGALGHILETTPHGEQDIGENIARFVGRDATTYVAQQRVVHIGDERFEAVSPLAFGAHYHPVSGIGRILSPFIGLRTHAGRSFP